MNRTALACTTIASLAILGAAAMVTAGPLDPPGGPVGSTLKTLAEVEPRIALNAANTPGDVDSLFKITQPGSYYLTGNITGVAGRHGIEVVASGVSIDLNGFDLAGVPGMGAFSGITAVGADLRNISIRNGSVRDWGDRGIDASGAFVRGGRVEGVDASGNAGIGLLAGAGFVVIGCSARSNGGDGIAAGTGSVITDCTASANAGDGIDAGSACTLVRCSATSNAGNGLSTLDGTTIAECTAALNTGNGIRVVNDCSVRANTCDTNGLNPGDGAAIFVLGGNNRIEANNCTDSDRGIDVNGPGNFIARNTCAGNTNNWDLVAGNVALVVNAATGGAFTGISGGVAPGSTDPNANFSY